MKSERILILPKGEFKMEEVYSVLDLVTYGNTSYMCIKDCAGILPTNTEYWKAFIDMSSVIPFRFGIDENGNYGYIKDGADTVTPFLSGGAGKPTYLIVNQGNGAYVIDMADYSERIITNTEMNTAYINDYFHLNFNTLYRNCHAVVADKKIDVHWLRNRSYARNDVSLDSGGNQFLWGASEFGGYAIVVCG